jgi:hypothetical protein
MTVQEALASPEVRAQYEQLVQTPEDRAAGMAAHWNNFNEGTEPEFSAYFMLGAHDELRQAFLNKIEASSEIPYPNNVRQAMLKTGRAVLWAASQGYEDGDPYAMYYTGTRVMPIE